MGLFVNRGAALFSLLAAGSVADWLEARSRPFVSWAERDVGGRSLVKAEAAGGGGRRPAFTRVRAPTTIAWRDRGAEGMSVCRSFLRPASAAARSASCIPNREDCVVVGMRQFLMRIDWDGGGQDPGHTPPIAAAAAFDVLVLPGAPKTGLGRVSFGRGLDFPPFLIRSEASLYEAQAEGLHARIRRSSGNSQPLCLIREARRPGTEGAGPILAAACCSHSPARRPAHLGGFSGSVWISFPCLIHETLNRASQPALALPHASARRTPSGMTPVSRYRHSATSNFRASATAITLRMRPLPSPTRPKNQRLSALSGWNRNQRQVSCSNRQRTRVLPFLEMPCSRSMPPLWNGVPVRPTNAAIPRRSRNGRLNTSRTSRVAVSSPIPQIATSRRIMPIPRSGSGASTSATRAASISAICSLATLCRFIRRRNWAIVCAGSAAPERARNFSSFSAAFFRRGRKSPMPCRPNRLWIWFSSPTP